jgi:UDP-N-acetylmuramate: L-alanyl-gamma-D-glutamyl-meso-diaminopimelate ligase
MGAAACLLREKGYEVDGGDLNYFPPMSDYLERTGIPLHDLNDLSWDSLKDYDLIVVGNVVPRAGDAARKIEELGVPFCSFPAILGAFVLHDLNVVGIAGTHGKTTTTYFMSQLFEKLGQDPGYFIGGVIEGRPSSSLGSGRYFFIESDEYDSAYFEKISKFRSYTLNHMVLTSLEFDHADIFDDIEDIKNEFAPVLSEIKGQIIANVDYNAIEDLTVRYSDRDWTLYGEHSENGPKIVEVSSHGTKFELRIKGQWHRFTTNVVGHHNILNLSTCILFAASEGFTSDQINEGIQNLKFVKRRQEVRGEYRGAIVIDDFAHHPRSVACTIDTIKTSYPDKKIVVVLEPNSATARSNIFQDEFAESLTKADQVIFAKPERATTVKSAQNLDFDLMVQELQIHQTQAMIASDLEELRHHIDTHVDPKTLLLVLSNGTCLGLWKSDFVKELTP